MFVSSTANESNLIHFDDMKNLEENIGNFFFFRFSHCVFVLILGLVRLGKVKECPEGLKIATPHS